MTLYRGAPSPLALSRKRERGSDNRAARDIIAELKRGPLAQLVEQETLNLLVVGSTPTRPTTSLNASAPRAVAKSHNTPCHAGTPAPNSLVRPHISRQRRQHLVATRNLAPKGRLPVKFRLGIAGLSRIAGFLRQICPDAGRGRPIAPLVVYRRLTEVRVHSELSFAVFPRRRDCHAVRDRGTTMERTRMWRNW